MIANFEFCTVLVGVAPRIDISAEKQMEESFRIPIVATLMFIVTMVAIFYLARQVSGYYEPILDDGRIAFIDRT